MNIDINLLPFEKLKKKSNKYYFLFFLPLFFFVSTVFFFWAKKIYYEVHYIYFLTYFWIKFIRITSCMCISHVHTVLCTLVVVVVQKKEKNHADKVFLTFALKCVALNIDSNNKMFSIHALISRIVNLYCGIFF